MDSLHYEIDEVLQNRVVELAKEKLDWLKIFKQNNGGIHRDLDNEIKFQMEEMEDYISEFSRRKINKKCCNRVIKELSEDLYYEMVCHIMGNMFRTALSNKVNKEEYMEHGYDANASCPYFTPDLLANKFDFNFGEHSIVGGVYYIRYTVKDKQLIDINEEAVKEVVLSMDELVNWNGKRWRAIPSILEDNKICFITYKKDNKNWNEIGDMIWDINEDTVIEKVVSFLKSLKDNKYKIYVSYKGQYIMYISFNVKEGKLGFFKLDSLESCREIGNRLINKIRRVLNNVRSCKNK